MQCFNQLFARMVGIALCCILLLKGDFHPDPNGRYAAHTDQGPAGRLAQAVPPRGITEKCVYGKHKDLTLPDGSSVRLSRGSSLSYTTDFSKKRETYLDGRASFDVKPNKDLLFIIHAGHTTLKMMGTRFDVISDKDGRKSRITLVSGKMKVENGNSPLVLNAGEQAIIDGENIKTRKPDHPEKYLLWPGEGPTIVFYHEELDTVIYRIANVYHVKVVNQDHVHGKPITGDFSLKKPLDKTLAALQYIEKWRVRLERRNDTIFLIKPKP